jgi:hemerythrin-like domain-containing protein
MNEPGSRRAFLAIAGAGVLLEACRKEAHAEPGPSLPSAAASSSAAPAGDAGDHKDEGVSATEDLMREHGVIRRVLVVYREMSARLRVETSLAAGATDALRKAATLMRTFGEDYHETQLEEPHVFPVVAKGGGALDAMVRTLVAQHRRGRAITDYVLAVTQKPVGARSVDLARALESFARMYDAHAAMEDTVVFPAWKKALSPKDLRAMGERFEDIEHTTFGKDGFDDAVEQVAAIEKIVGLDLSTLTAPPPPLKP